MEENPFNNVATFIVKLWKMLNKAEAVDIMYWNPSGKSFIIQNQVLFITKLLPMYFKHNNMGSFIRQLNLYDFHKICIDKSLELEYQHKYFQRDREDLLKYIKRKLPQYKRVVYTKVDRDELTRLSKDVITIKNKQEEMGKQLTLLQQENISLLKELANLHAKQNTQSQVLKKIIEILIPVVETCNLAPGSNKNEGTMDKICDINLNLAKKLDAISKNNIYNWLEHDQLDFKKVVSNRLPIQENGDKLKLCDPPSSEVQLMSSVNSFMDLKDLAANINQPVAFNEENNSHLFLQSTDKAYLDNDLSNLLEGDMLGYNLLGQSNGLDQESKSQLDLDNV